MWHALLPQWVIDIANGGATIIVVIILITLGFKLGSIRILIWLVTKLMK